MIRLPKEAMTAPLTRQQDEDDAVALDRRTADRVKVSARVGVWGFLSGLAVLLLGVSGTGLVSTLEGHGHAHRLPREWPWRFRDGSNAIATPPCGVHLGWSPSSASARSCSSSRSRRSFSVWRDGSGPMESMCR